MKQREAEIWAASWVQPFWSNNIATIVIDHVVKSEKNRGRNSIGSERKLGGVDVHLGLEPVKELTRGGHRVYKIVTHKDRPGYLPRPRGRRTRTREPPRDARHHLDVQAGHCAGGRRRLAASSSKNGSRPRNSTSIRTVPDE